MARHEIYHVDVEVFPDGRFAAWVWINGNLPHLLLVNATATRTALLRDIVQNDLRLPPFMTAIGPSDSSARSATPLTLYRLDGISLGQYWIEHPLIAIADEVSDSLAANLDALGVEGMLGMDWLRLHFDRALVDLGEKRLELWQRVDEPSDA